MNHAQIATIDLEELRQLRHAAEQEHLARQTQEAQRKKIVAGLIETLTSQGFEVDSPYLDPQHDFVVVRAQRDQGQRVMVRVARDGHMESKHDNYAEMQCLQDLEELEARLHQAYGFNIEEKRVVWAADGVPRAQRQQEASSQSSTTIRKITTHTAKSR